jgi:hypothetical protein
MSDARRDLLEQFQQLRPTLGSKTGGQRADAAVTCLTPRLAYYLNEDCLPVGIRSETVAFVPSGAVSRRGTVPVLRPLG